MTLWLCDRPQDLGTSPRFTPPVFLDDTLRLRTDFKQVRISAIIRGMRFAAKRPAVPRAMCTLTPVARSCSFAVVPSRSVFLSTCCIDEPTWVAPRTARQVVPDCCGCSCRVFISPGIWYQYHTTHSAILFMGVFPEFVVSLFCVLVVSSWCRRPSQSDPQYRSHPCLMSDVAALPAPDSYTAVVVVWHLNYPALGRGQEQKNRIEARFAYWMVAISLSMQLIQNIYGCPYT